MDSADHMAYRQAEVLVELNEGIQAGGMDVQQLYTVWATKIPFAARGHLSDRTRRIFRDVFTYRRGSVPPRVLKPLIFHLSADFDAAQRLYTNKGLLQQAPREEVEVTSTMRRPASWAEAAGHAGVDDFDEEEQD